MSERWGFDLSMEAVRLMRRDAEQWQEFAREKLEGDDIETRLAALVAKANTDQPVEIFLPRDQILYTQVELKNADDAENAIRSSMDGRTPYALDELEIDWELVSASNAQVAAVAHETLQEAEAFVTKGGLSVRAFSSLDTPAEFPRPPVFAEKQPVSEAAPIETDATPAFSTARATTAVVLEEAEAKPEQVADVSTNEPVVKVDDPTPVLQLPKSALPPLNPGAPLPRPTSEPRIHTDIGAVVAQGRAASLTPSSGITIHRRDRAVPTPALAAIAAALSIGIAIIIWTIIPTSPQTSGVAEELISATEPETEEVALSEPAPEPEPEIGPYTFAISVAASQPKTTDLAETSPVLKWASIPASNGSAIPAALSPTLSLAGDPQPTVVWLAPRPGALEGLEAFVPSTLSYDGNTTTDVSTVLASLTTQSDALLLRADVRDFPDAKPLRLPELDTAPPEPLPPVLDEDELVAETTEPEALETDKPVADTIVAALDPEVDATTPQLPITDEAPLSLEEESAPTIEPEVPVADSPATSPEVTETATEQDAPSTEPDFILPTPTALAAAVPDTAPRIRPAAFEADIERQKFGGRTLVELSEIRPGQRPASAQMEALIALAGAPPSELAVQTSFVPRGKPGDFDAIVAASILQQRQEREARAVAAATPDTSDAIEAALAEDAAAEPGTRPQDSPRLAIPSNASVARQATIEDAIRLNRISLVGVFGRPSDRRALIRLPSGQYIKVEVGDRVDGGTVAAISETALQYQKGGRTVALTLPQG